MEFIDKFKSRYADKNERIAARNKKRYRVNDLTVFTMNDRYGNLAVKIVVPNNDMTKFKDLPTGQIYDFFDYSVDSINDKIFRTFESFGYKAVLEGYDQLISVLKLLDNKAKTNLKSTGVYKEDLCEGQKQLNVDNYAFVSEEDTVRIEKSIREYAMERIQEIESKNLEIEANLDIMTEQRDF